MQTRTVSRRDLLLIGAGLGAAAVAAVPAQADIAPMSKASVGYQDVPQNGQVCAACVYFEFYASTGGGAPASRCKLVAGPINPAGWCEVWQAKG
jgi:hypothetical protein